MSGRFTYVTGIFCPGCTARPCTCSTATTVLGQLGQGCGDGRGSGQGSGRGHASGRGQGSGRGQAWGRGEAPGAGVRPGAAACSSSGWARTGARAGPVGMGIGDRAGPVGMGIGAGPVDRDRSRSTAHDCPFCTMCTERKRQMADI